MRNRGFSLIEVLMVLALMAVLTTLALPTMRDFNDARRLEGLAYELATDIQLARSDAVARNRPLRLRVQVDGSGSCYVVHTLGASDCTCAGSGSATCTHADAVIIKSVSLPLATGVQIQGNVSSVVFEPGTGTVTPAGSFTMTSGSGKSIRQVVNILGRPRTCSPGGTMPHLDVC